MIFDGGFGTTVVAIYPSLGILQMRGHRLYLNQALEMLKMSFHVKHASTADRASV